MCALCFAKYCIDLVTNVTSLVNWSKLLASKAAASMSVAGIYDLTPFTQGSNAYDHTYLLCSQRITTDVM